MRHYRKYHSVVIVGVSQCLGTGHPNDFAVEAD